MRIKRVREGRYEGDNQTVIPALFPVILAKARIQGWEMVDSPPYLIRGRLFAVIASK